MKEDKKYYKLLDIIRVVSCIGVLLYHLGYLQGGFLSVCSFFVLSGYLSYISLSRKDKVNFKEYYKKRFKHIYLPLLIVVFITTCITAFMGDIHWFQLKPESTSVLFGYNNYWQLSVNADYFARHVSSPFMHFWYIAILLQFEIIFPFIYLFIKKTKEKIHKVFPIIILSILITASSGYFIYISLNNNIMLSYYDTLARSFSLFIGVLLGYIHKEYKPLYFKRFSNIFFYLYLVIFIVLQFIINSNNTYYWLVMIIVSLLTCRLIDYGTSNDSSNLNFWERETKFLADTSYEIYLVQYPIIFFFQYTDLDIAWKMPIMILLIFGFAYFIHFTLDFKNTKGQYLRLVFGIIIAIFSAFGLVEYVHAKDYTEEMNKLRDQLSENQKMIQDKQKDYEERLKQEQEEWNKVMNDLDSGEECNQSICLKKSIFDEHLKYLKDNGYNTLSVKDLDLWLDRKIELPAKSVLITVDDGAMGTDTHLIELLEKYDLRATLFLITSWWDKDKYKSHNLDIQSHGDNLHVERYCNGVSRGAKGLCLSKKELVDDLKKSIKKLDGENTAFCYPFYLYNKNMLDAMKEVGFKLGFAGGDRKVKRTDDKYMLPRYIIYNYDDVNMLKNILK